MLRHRHSTKSKSDIKHRKSTSSVHSVHLEHIDPVVAHRDAQAAACQAYARAQGREKADMSLFPPTPDSSPRRPQTSINGLGEDDAGTPCHGRESSQTLRRRQSVRFMGPCSVERRTGRRSGVYSERSSWDPDPQCVRLQENFDTNSSRSYVLGDDGGDFGIRQLGEPSQPHRKPPPIPLSGFAAEYLDSLLNGDQQYTPEDDIASAPSSYRRLRRSRSMFASEGHGARRSQDGSLSFLDAQPPSDSQSPTSKTRRILRFDSEVENNSTPSPLLRAPKSMSFLRSRNIRSRTSTSRDGHSAGHPLAGPPLLPEEELQTGGRVTPQHVNRLPGFFGSRSRRNEPGIPKSLRCSNSDEGFKTKARKVSKSLKTKLKTFFSLSKSEDQPPSLPDQHIDAQRTYATERCGSLLSSDAGHETCIVGDWGSIHRVPAKMPSLQTVPANLLHSNRGSVESLRSERERKVSDDKSLTSWTNSGPSTLTSQQQQQWREWERQRLSIITEHGTHAPSPSFPRKALGTQLFQQHDNNNGKPIKQLSDTLDQKSHPRADGSHCLRATASSESLGKPPSNTPKTIRCVASHQNFHASDPAITPTRGQIGRFRTGSPVAPSARRFGLEPAKREVKGLCAAFRAARPRSASNCTASSAKTAGDNNDETPSAALGSPYDELRSFQDRSSAFFGSPTSHLFRTTSPFRRALRKSIEEEEQIIEPRQNPSDAHSSDCDTQVRGTGQYQNTDSEPANNMDYSESVYSSDGQDAAETRPNLGPLTTARDANTPGGIRLTYQPAGYRTDSSVSSIDWKTWLSANVAKMEQSPMASSRSEVEFALPTMPKSFTSGHVREPAQIFDDYDDEEFDVFEPPTHKPTLPTTPLAVVEPNVVKLSPLQRSVKRITPPSGGRPLLENDSPTGAPPIPLKSPLRGVAPPPLKFVATAQTARSATPSVASSPGLTAAVQRQFGSYSFLSKSFR
ncbi:hypothetical protein B0T26DRAFT_744310 [Lasiosphaeria miniovina]|uniref:Uncharacterized protein n=1 Tax=Lasiosphaeria miniovina TaxID=1954250 RepID=A0AA39ZTX3_9PEZI|nr:uncharacterized protein B0T26DRAFT_744310 [Lasiosphaeria miniovina]KAK0703511.1 hypothetical protein B0T26DRAFT_744310 [Lasiosphaeria miniovina]